MNYRIEILPSAQRELTSLPSRDRRRVDERIRCLAENPRPPGVKALAGPSKLFRLRAGKYRVIYQIRGDVLLVLIVKIGHRGDVYRKL